MNALKRNNGSGKSGTRTLRTLRTSRSSFSESSGEEESSNTLHHSSSTISLSESSVTGARRVFSSPLTTFKKKVTFKPRKVSLVKEGDLLQGQSSERELSLDNAEYLSGLMSLNAGKQPTTDIDKSFASDGIDKSFASDFDESARWLNQHF